MATYHGRVHGGVVILDDGAVLPEGAPVTVTYDAVVVLIPPAEGKRVEAPLVRSAHPGSVDLTNERIAEIFEEEDIAYYRPFSRDADERSS